MKWWPLNPKVLTNLILVTTAEAGVTAAQIEGSGPGWRFVLGGAIVALAGLIGGYLTPNASPPAAAAPDKAEIAEKVRRARARRAPRKP